MNSSSAKGISGLPHWLQIVIQTLLGLWILGMTLMASWRILYAFLSER